MERIAVVISVGLVALAAAPAAWAESDRAAAGDFGRAARQLYAAAGAQRQVVETGVNRLTRDPVCDDAVRHVPQKVRVYEAAVELVFSYEVEALITPIEPALRDYVAALDRVRTSDRRLRSGRAALRLSERAVRGIKAAPADICAQLQAWQQAGYPVKGAPKIDDPALGALSKGTDSLGKKVERAAKRLRALGVSKRTARLFTGDTDVLYKGWDLDNEVPIGDATG
ncbi:MAG TPA: hypothetical protein VJU80_02550 [Solirubrobacteraceae bacterium]|nr:hypothetical protein [Solirubrobacteraceae bacterium]